MAKKSSGLEMFEDEEKKGEQQNYEDFNAHRLFNRKVIFVDNKDTRKFGVDYDYNKITLTKPIKEYKRKPFNHKQFKQNKLEEFNKNFNEEVIKEFCDDL